MKPSNRMLRAVAAGIAIGGLSATVPALAEDGGIGPAPVLVESAEDLLQPLALEAADFKTQIDVALSALPNRQADAIRSFYADRSYAPFWAEADRVDDLMDAISRSVEHGIPSTRYSVTKLRAQSGDRAALEISGMTAYLAYADDLSSGMLNPSSVDPEINIKPRRPTASEHLVRLRSGDVVGALEATAPQDPDYARLLQERSRLDEVIAAGGWSAPVPDGPTLRVGESDAQVPLLRARLASQGYTAAPDAALGPDVLDAALASALKSFQADHGLVDDGALGARTRQALNVSAEVRQRQVLVNLERMRWMNQDPGDRYIAVNIPDYRVEMIDDGVVVWQSRTVVGENPKTRTPEFSDKMTYFVVNPTWHIPDSIATRVYLPKLSRDPSVLARSNMSLFTRSGVEINPGLVNFSQYSAKNFPFRIKQNPSTANALGRVKFMFPNQYAIYLHDTPSRSLFDKDRRAFSNGCIRLERPVELSYTLLDGQVGDPVNAMKS